MSNTEAIGNEGQNIQDPITREPRALVENIYPVPGTTTVADLESQDTMASYLISRFEPPEISRTRVVLTPTGRTMPWVHRVTTGHREVTRRRKTNEWRVSPRLSAAVILGSAALFNIVGNTGTIAGSARLIGYEISHAFDFQGPEAVTYPVVTPGRVENISVTSASGDKVDATSVNGKVIHSFVKKIEKAEHKHGKLVDIQITGNTSDEWGGDASIGEPSLGNALLGEARANVALAQAKKDGLKLKPDEVKLGQHEHVVSEVQRDEVLTESQADGFPTISSAIEAVDDGQPVAPGLASQIKSLFTNIKDRGVSLSAKIVYPGKAHTTIESTLIGPPPIKEHAPGVPSPHFYGFIPLPPIRRRECYTAVKEVRGFEYLSSKVIHRPQIIREDVEQEWLRIRPEAVNADGTLVDEAWAYTRKYEDLLKDGRLAHVIRADFKDSKGEDKSLRVIFVDQSPTDQTMTAFEQLLTKFASMQDGKLADRVSAIFVYPSESAGTEHGNPKKIAMGIDKQSENTMIGAFNYPLKLVELHMPTTFDGNELEELFKFNGTMWVTAHEVAGHGTDINNTQQRLRRVLARGIPNAHVIDGDPRAVRMSRLKGALKKLPTKQSQKSKPIEYDVDYTVLDRNGKNVTISSRVKEGDQGLAHATSSTIVDHQPTVYSGENDPEHYAETAAAVTTGIEIPYDEALTSVEQLETDQGETASFAPGFHPDKRGQEVFTDAVGAISDSLPVEFEKPIEVSIQHLEVEGDPLLRAELARTSKLRSPEPNQLIAILARTSRRKK